MLTTTSGWRMRNRYMSGSHLTVRIGQPAIDAHVGKHRVDLLAGVGVQLVQRDRLDRSSCATAVLPVPCIVSGDAAAGEAAEAKPAASAKASPTMRSRFPGIVGG